MNQEFRVRIVGMHGERGAHWLDSLPSLIASLEQEWGFTSGPPLRGAYNCVLLVQMHDGTDAVLKLGLPRREVTNEIRWLETHQHGRCVQLHRADYDRGVMLLEHLSPGTDLTTLDDDEATRIAADIMLSLQTPPIEDFPTVMDWAKAFDRYRAAHGNGGPIPHHLIDEATHLYRELDASAAHPTLLHGDLHHYNVLSHTGRWKVIDPQGVIGELAYETATLLRNPNPIPLHQPAATQRTRRRLDILAETLNIDRERIRLWGYAHGILSACWTVEDNEPNLEYDLACTELLRSG